MRQLGVALRQSLFHRLDGLATGISVKCLSDNYFLCKDFHSG